jgi:hypothetical protein
MSVHGLPQVPTSALPASVRDGSKADRDAYSAALGFEQILLGQLVGDMLPEGEMTDGPRAAAMQDAFTSGLIANGGLGLAAQLYPSMRKDAS